MQNMLKVYVMIQINLFILHAVDGFHIDEINHSRRDEKLEYLQKILRIQFLQGFVFLEIQFYVNKTFLKFTKTPLAKLLNYYF